MNKNFPGSEMEGQDAPEEKETKENTSFSLPTSLVNRLGMALARHHLRKQKSAVVVRLLEQWCAWAELAKPGSPLIFGDYPVANSGNEKSPTNEGVTVRVGTAGSTLIRYLPSDISEEEGKWLRRALRVIRSDKKSLATALKFNLHEFAEVSERYERERGADADSQGDTGSSEQGGLPNIDEEIDAVRRALDAVEEDTKRSHQRKELPPGKTGGRR